MKPRDDKTALRQEAQHLLAPAWRSVHRARLRIAMSRGLQTALLAMGIVSVAWVAWRVGASLGAWSPIRWWVYAAGLFVAGALPLLQQFLSCAANPPTLTEAAERLDLAVVDHNRIATALYLLDHPTAGTFAQAALEDGVRQLRTATARSPLNPDPPKYSSRRAGMFIAAALAVGITAFLGAPSQATLAPDAPPEASEKDTASRPSFAALDPPKQKPPTTSAPAPTVVVTSRPHAEAGSLTKRTEMRRTGSTAGRAGAGAGAMTEAPETAENAQASASESPTKSPSANKPAARQKPRKPQPKRPNPESDKPPNQQDASSISQGSSASGTTSSVQHSWSQKGQSVDEDKRDDDTDADAEEDNEANTQRGGIQPSLKDRQAAPSRELGISEGEGPPGAGRGGPTPPKKSRGTASLVLGVPVPDFVRGRMGPGTTKITRERATPVPMPAPPPDAAPGAAAHIAETYTGRLALPPEFAPMAQDYLTSLHAADEPSQPPASAPSAQESNQP